MIEKNTSSTSKSGKAKLERAIHQLENVDFLIRGLPRHIYNPNKETLRKLADQVTQIAYDLEKILRNQK